MPLSGKLTTKWSQQLSSKLRRYVLNIPIPNARFSTRSPVVPDRSLATIDRAFREHHIPPDFEVAQSSASIVNMLELHLPLLGKELHLPLLGKKLQILNEKKEYKKLVSIYRIIDSKGIGQNFLILNLVMNGFAHLGCPQLCFSILGKILKLGYNPNRISYTTLIKSLCINERPMEALELHQLLVKEGESELDIVSYGTLITGLCKNGKLNLALELLKHVEDNKLLLSNAMVYNPVIDEMCKGGFAVEGYGLFQRMLINGVIPTVVTYNSMIHGFCLIDRIGIAMSLFNEMLLDNIKPSVVTFSILVDYFCKKRRIEKANSVIGFMLVRGIKPNVVTLNSLIYGQFLVGDVKRAKWIFNSMVHMGIEPTEQSYRIMLSGYYNTGLVEEARQIFEEMYCRQKMTGDDDFTFCGRVEELYKSILDHLMGLGVPVNGD